MNMNFGQAIEALKQGKKVARSGWNGKGQYVFLVDHIQCEGIAAYLKDDVEFVPALAIRTSANQI